MAPSRPSPNVPTRTSWPAAPTSWSRSTSATGGPTPIVALRRVDELRDHASTDTHLELGATVTYAHRRARPRRRWRPAWPWRRGPSDRRRSATPARSAATSAPPVPAGDTLPWLAALDAEVVLVSAADGERVLPLRRVHHRPEARPHRRDDELIRAVRVPRVAGPAARRRRSGTRNAMVISVASLAIVVDTGARRVRVGLGSVGPVPVRPTTAEDLASDGASTGTRLTCDADAVDRVRRGRAPTPAPPSTTTAAPPTTAATPSACWPPAMPAEVPRR